MASVRARRSARLAASSPSRLTLVASRPLPNSAARSAAASATTDGALLAVLGGELDQVGPGPLGEPAGERRRGPSSPSRRGAAGPSASRAGGRVRGRRRRAGRAPPARRVARPGSSAARRRCRDSGGSGANADGRAAAEHGVEQRGGLGGDQDQVGVAGRLLEGLEQGVLALLGHRVGRLDDEDPPGALERPVGDRADHLAADLLDEMLVAGRPQPGQVRVRRGVERAPGARIGRVVGVDRPAASPRARGRRQPCRCRSGRRRRRRARGRGGGPPPGPCAPRLLGRGLGDRAGQGLAHRAPVSGSLAQISSASQHPRMDLLDGTGRVDDDDPLGLGGGDPVEGGGDPVLEGGSLRLEPVGDRRHRSDRAPARRRVAGVGPQQDGPVGHAAADGGRVQGLDKADVDAPGAALVGDGRVDEPVADDVAAGLDRRRDDPLDQLGPGGAEEHQLGPRRQLDRGVLEQVAEPLAGRRSAGLPQQQRLGAERLGEQPRLRRLAGAVDSLEGDEQRSLASGGAGAGSGRSGLRRGRRSGTRPLRPRGRGRRLLASRPSCPSVPVPFVSEVVPLASASFLRFSASSLAFWRSARFSRISTIEGQSSFRQRFQGRPRKPLTFSRGVSPQIEQRSSSRQSS